MLGRTSIAQSQYVVPKRKLGISLIPVLKGEQVSESLDDGDVRGVCEAAGLRSGERHPCGWDEGALAGEIDGAERHRLLPRYVQ